jgi:hypothetical protein
MQMFVLPLDAPDVYCNILKFATRIQGIVLTSSKNINLQTYVGYPLDLLWESVTIRWVLGLGFGSYCCLFLAGFDDTWVTMSASLTSKQEHVMRYKIIGEFVKFINPISV